MAIIDLNAVDATIDTLEVKWGEASYMVPLANSLTIEEIKGMNQQDKVFEFFCKYIPVDVFNNIPVPVLSTLMTAWTKESEKVLGHKLGES